MRGTQPMCETHHKKDLNMNLEDDKRSNQCRMSIRSNTDYQTVLILSKLIQT